MSTLEQSAGEQRRVAILGSGYTAAVAAEIIHHHPDFKLAVVASRSKAGGRFDWISQDWAVPLHGLPIVIEHPSNIFEDPESWELDAALVTYADAEGAEASETLQANGLRVVDLGGGLRLRDPETRERWYGEDTATDLLASEDVVYGLTELYRDEIREAEVVANPGCYPTASVLGLAPLAREGLIESVQIEAYSGISGAGLGGREKFKDTRGDVVEYGRDGHRHQPEIEQELAALGCHGPVEFRPHVITDVFQGMSLNCNVTLNREAYRDEIETLYQDAYRDEPFVEVVVRPPSMEAVRETNLCRMYVASLDIVKGNKFSVRVVIDNLWKGASSQAVQNLNLMHGLPEETGLPASTLERIAG
ncbi:MAG: N-acetyl-gamma-glutamyl-phosphate reductase [bacterium]|nr:N-acetyl-gamma-glutamyl-phosphate reductase [bacterium]MDZ4248222.1 N-acetyl-gamma-glutamyl-phosphate reductase [Patescibacteria group bacterium]